MAKVQADEIRDAIVDVLLNASCGRGGDVGFLTAYQILDRLPKATRDLLYNAYGGVGGGTNHNYGAATRVAEVAAEIVGPELRYLDTGGLQFQVADNPTGPTVPAGFELCGLFRLPFGHPLRTASRP